jgi:DNA-binding FadR family transcriptional regulator
MNDDEGKSVMRVRTPGPWSARRLKRSEVVARMLVDRIQSLEMNEGDRLEPEVAMIEELQVGRGTLREAFRILELSGILEVRTGPTGGPTVRRPETDNYGSMTSLFLAMRGATARDILEAVMILEPPMAARAARLRTAEELKDLEQALDDEFAVGRADSPGFMHGLRKFGDALVRMGRNPAIEMYLQGSHWIMANVWREMLTVRDIQAPVLRAHQSIFEAVKAQDDKRAEFVTRRQHEAALAYTLDKFKATIEQPIRWY